MPASLIPWAARLIALFFRFMNGLWRIELIRFPEPSQFPGPWIYAHWHGDELMVLGTFADRGMATMASRSRDGELMKGVLENLGYFVVRGSSSRGGAGGLKGLIDAIHSGRREASMAVDGPRGPIYEVKPGVIKLAQATGAWIVPGVSAAKSKFVFKNAWNRCYLPYPFSRAVIVCGEPFRVSADASDETLEILRRDLEQQLRALKVDAERLVARPKQVLNPVHSGV